jgi:hypothetical protein
MEASTKGLTHPWRNIALDRGDRCFSRTDSVPPVGNSFKSEITPITTFSGGPKEGYNT